MSKNCCFPVDSIQWRRGFDIRVSRVIIEQRREAYWFPFVAPYLCRPRSTFHSASLQIQGMCYFLRDCKNSRNYTRVNLAEKVKYVRAKCGPWDRVISCFSGLHSSRRYAVQFELVGANKVEMTYHILVCRTHLAALHYFNNPLLSLIHYCSVQCIILIIS